MLALMPDIQLTVLIGRYAQVHDLPSARHDTLTDTVDFRRFVPDRFPIVHPSPLNFRWHTRNPWFVSEVLPELRTHVRDALGRVSRVIVGVSTGVRDRGPEMRKHYSPPLRCC